MKVLLRFCAVLTCALGLQAELVFCINSAEFDDVECWNSETCYPAEAYLDVTVLGMLFEVPMELVAPQQYEYPPYWFVYEDVIPEEIIIAPMMEVCGFHAEFVGPGFAYTVDTVVNPPVIYFFDTPDFIPPIEVDVPPGNGCLEPAAAEELEHSFELQDAYPNPCNGSAVIEYSLPATQQAELAVYNLRGQQMALLASGLQEAGEHSVRVEMDTWPSGVYLCQLRSDGLCRSTRIVLMR